MTKTQAIELFGSKAAIARALGVSRQAVQAWPESLDRKRSDQILGAATRLDINKRRQLENIAGL